MKTLKTFILLSLFVTSITFGQSLKLSEVPQAVKEAFTSKNMKATDIEWERDLDNYKVEFDIGRMEHEIWYTADGDIIKRENDIPHSELPKAIRDAITLKYAGYRLDDIEMNWQDNLTTYKVELEKGKEEWKVVFDANGKIIQERRD